MGFADHPSDSNLNSKVVCANRRRRNDNRKTFDSW